MRSKLSLTHKIELTYVIEIKEEKVYTMLNRYVPNIIHMSERKRRINKKKNMIDITNDKN